MYFFLAWKECWLITTRKLPVAVAEVKTIFTVNFAGHRSPHRGRRAAVWAAAAAECRLVLQFSANSQWGRSAKIFVSNTKIFYHHRQHQKSLDVVFQVVTHPKHICVYTFEKIFVSRPDRNICDTPKYLWHSKIFVTHVGHQQPCGGGRGGGHLHHHREALADQLLHRAAARRARQDQGEPRQGADKDIQFINTMYNF